jgi:solute carrier family 35 protein E3
MSTLISGSAPLTTNTTNNNNNNPQQQQQQSSSSQPPPSPKSPEPMILIAGYRFNPTTLGYMAFNFGSSVGIVFVNKLLFGSYHMSYSTFVTGIHFVVTFICVIICQRLKMFEPKSLRHLDVLPITIAFCGFVVFNNLSLQYNSVGFYQLMKVLTTPVIVVLQYFIYGVKEDKKLVMALIPVIIGVILATVNDFSFNVLGASYAVAGILSTSFYQMFVKSKQDQLGANSWQLLKVQAPQAAIVVFILTPLFDTVHSTSTKIGLFDYLRHDASTMAYFLLITSAILAFCVNLSIFLVVGRTDPVVYNVLGHFKLLVILTGGLIFQGEDSNPIRLFGMALAFAGITHYTNLKQTIASQWKTPMNNNRNSSSSNNNNNSVSNNGLLDQNNRLENSNNANDKV